MQQLNFKVAGLRQPQQTIGLPNRGPCQDQSVQQGCEESIRILGGTLVPQSGLLSHLIVTRITLFFNLLLLRFPCQGIQPVK
jgi:hypothetical protein